MSLHFYNLRSRMGMHNLPWKQDEFNIGVEEGGDFILSEEFLARFSTAKVDTYTFPLPEEVDHKKYYEIVAEHSKRAITLIEETLQEDEMQVVLGGDHSIAFCSLVALLRRLHSHSIGYIQVDSHPDTLSQETSSTKNFHGMWMRPFIDDFDIDAINELVPHKLKSEQVLYIGNLDMEPEEERVLTANKIQVISVEDMRLKNEKTIQQIKKFMDTFEHIHLDIDIDGFDKSVAPATGIPAKNGLIKKDITQLLELFSKKESRSLDLVEVNPQKKGSEKTVAFAQDILDEAFKKEETENSDLEDIDDPELKEMMKE